MIADRQPRFQEREWLRDAGFEIWSGAVLSNWTPSANLTLAQDTTVVRPGSTFSAKVTRTDALFAQLVANEAVNLPRFAWYFVGVWAQATVQVTDNVRIRFVNARTGYSWDDATKTWIAGAAGSIYGIARTSGLLLTGGWVATDAQNALASDGYQMQLAGYFGDTNSLWYDDASVFGPYAKPIAQVGLGALTYHAEGFRRFGF